MKRHLLATLAAIVPLVATIATVAGISSAAVITPAFAHGCTPGFWKNHLEELPFSETATLNDLFGTSLSSDLNLSAEEALNARGGGFNALVRHAVSALANSLTIDDYRYTESEVIDLFQDAIDDNKFESIKNKFESANEAPSCPF
jgi:hypothetical protein